jgi:hypothetical protein
MSTQAHGEHEAGWSRRELIQRGGVAALALGGANVLAACSGSSVATSSSGTATGGGPGR